MLSRPSERRWVIRLFLLNAIIFFAIVPAYFLRRDDIHRTLVDVTGEEDSSYQLRALGFFALSLFRPPRDTADYVPMPYIDMPPFGINTFFEQEVEEQKIRTGMQLIRDAGFHFIRQEFPWEDIEIPGKGQFFDPKFNKSAWEKYDRLVALAEEYDLEIIARLDHPPAWTRADGHARGYFAPPDDYDDYGDFVSAVVSRYKGRIKYYQLWNEPNIYPEWGEQPVNAQDYTRLLKIGYQSAKEADPDAVIISAGLAQTLETGPRNVSDLIFLQQMYDAGAKDYFDILAVMNYGLFTGPGDKRADPSRTNFSRPILIREIMVKNGDANKPIWAMEIGWNALPTGFTDAPFGRVTEQQQGRYAAHAYERAQTEWPWMGVMNYWFFKRAYDNEREQPFFYFRLFDPDFTPRPAYQALKNYTPTARWLGKGFHQETNWTLDYIGAWGRGASGEKPTEGYAIGTRDDTLRFIARGNEIELALAPIPYGGIIEASVDGGAFARHDLRATDPAGEHRISLAGNLLPGAHKVEVRVLQGELRLDGIVVKQTNTWWVTATGWILLCIALVIGGIVFFIRRLRQGAAISP
ncbi:MAG: cellulase family glycosylhydrolase [Anaerolineae bacterium]|nr:cellulase family glycosylhydrolase [Anaerolineae bacterium]